MSAHSVGRDDEYAADSWSGPTRRYDLVKEFVVALLVVSLLAIGLSAVFSSPDERQVTIATWANAEPNDFVLTAAAELDRSSGTATYGAPYTHNPDAAQKIGPVSLQDVAGVTTPIDTVTDFVMQPLEGSAGDPELTNALESWSSASASTQQRWATTYDAALQQAPDNDPASVAAGDYGPTPVMLNRLLEMARNGGLDGALLTQGQFYQTDYTKPLLFIADGTYLEERADREHLTGEQWGMMNETGSYPGQAWLWLYTFWYQVKPFSTSDNADALVWALMVVLTLALVLVPFLPGVRSLPRLLRVHRLIWRDHYRSVERR